MKDVSLSPEDRCEANVRAWARWFGLGELGEAVERRSDRCFFELTPGVGGRILRFADSGRLLRGNYKNHGETAVAGWREDVSRAAAQVIWHRDGRIEVDFDYWNPRDVVGIVGHLAEVAVNKVRRRKTDPWKVAGMLKARGVDVTV